MQGTMYGRMGPVSVKVTIVAHCTPAAHSKDTNLNEHFIHENRFGKDAFCLRAHDNDDVTNIALY